MSRIRTRTPFNRPQQAIRIVRNDAASEAEVFLYDEIGYFGIQADPFVRELRSLQVETLHVRINSPGGDVFDGHAIANALRDHPAEVVAHVDALAASIASVIAMGADTVRMAPNAFLMIHDPWTITLGNAAQLRKDAAVLDKLTVSLRDAYVNRTGQSAEQITAWMAAETWFSAQDALDAGFADAIDDAHADASASFDLSMFAHAPAALMGADAGSPNIRQLERALRDAGLSRSAAKAVLADGYHALEQRDAADGDVLAQVRQLAATITSVTH